MELHFLEHAGAKTLQKAMLVSKHMCVSKTGQCKILLTERCNYKNKISNRKYKTADETIEETVGTGAVTAKKLQV